MKTQVTLIYFFIVILIAFTTKNSFSQSLYLSTKKAERLISTGQLKKGQELFEKTLKVDSLYSRANIGLAKLEVYYFGNFQKACKLFSRGIKHSKKDTNFYVLFDYAKALSLFNKPQKAIEIYELIKNNKKVYENDIKFKADVDREVSYCKSQVLKSNFIEKDIKISNLGNTVNTAKSEYTSIISHQSNKIYYNGRYQDFSKENRYEDDYYFENIYQTNYTGSEKKLCLYNMQKNVHFAVVNKVGNSDSLLVYFENKLWIVKYKDSLLSKKEPLPQVFGNYYQQPSGVFSKNQNLFIFSAKKTIRDNLDIYYSQKDINGVWSKPLKYDSNINSPLDEDGVFLADNDETLYFSSKGFNSTGEYDVFKSQLKNNTWSKAVLLDYPINSPANDIYYVVDNNNNAFLSSNRFGGYGLMDIYKVQQHLKPIFDCPKFENPELTINFDLSESINNEMVDLKYKWYFDDGSTANGEVLSKTFEYPGSHEIKIDVIDTSIDLIEKQEIKKTINIDSVNYIGYKYDNNFFLDSISNFDASVSYMKGHLFKQYFWKVNDSILNIDSSILNYTFLEKDTFDVSLQINSIDEKGDFKSFCYSKKLIVIEPKDLILSDSTTVPNKHDYVSNDSIVNLLNQFNVSKLGNIKPIYFRFDKSFLTKKSIKELNNIVNFLNANPSYRLIIYGNTDAMGSENYNEKLAKRRIISTIKYLNKKNIAKNRIIKTVNNGELNPVEPNVLKNGKDNPKGRRLNRRVEFKVIE